MFKATIASAALLALVSSSAFASVESELGHELLAAQATIEGIVSGSIAVDPSTHTDNTPDLGTGSGTGTGTGTGEDWFQDDAKAQPEYLQSARNFGESGKKFLESDSLLLRGLYADSVIKKTEACADLNIALVDLSVANHYSIQPGFSMLLKPFNAQFKSLYDNINNRRGLICK